ncbi:O-antigen ligase family protein [Microbacterium rhizophilus]|uniref:O-antigen ligase family protein n=1 Tax=Microbacterium rhizophilus TaxID=3138934 RepID=UPI0031F0CAF1
MDGTEILSAVAGGSLIFLAAVVLFTLAADRRRKVLSFLVGGSAALVAAQVFDVHLFTIFVVIWAIDGQRASRSWTPREVVLPLVSAALLASTALYGELVNSPTLGLQLLALSICTVILVLHGNRHEYDTMLVGLLVVTSLSSAWAVLQVVGIAPNDAWHLDVSSLGRPTGFYPEPDWLGMFAGIALLLAWRLPMGPRTRVLLVLVNAAAWVLAFARAAWVAVAVAVVFVAVIRMFTRRRDRPAMMTRRVKRRPQPHRLRHRSPAPRRPRTGRGVAVVLLVISGLVVLATVPSLREDLFNRLSRTLVARADDVSAQARVQQNEGLLHLAQTAPWNGWGISASGRVGVSGRLTLTGDSTNNVGSNWIVSMWVDGAWLAIPLILVLLIAPLVAARTIQAQLLVLVLVNSLFSNAVFQPVTWMLLGLCLAYARDRRETSPRVEGRRAPRQRRPAVHLSV